MAGGGQVLLVRGLLGAWDPWQGPSADPGPGAGERARTGPADRPAGTWLVWARRRLAGHGRALPHHLAEGAVVLALRRSATVEAGGDDGHPDLVAERVVDDGAEDDVGLRVRGLLDEAGGLVDLEEAEVTATLHGQQHAVRSVDGGLEQRAS